VFKLYTGDQTSAGIGAPVAPLPPTLAPVGVMDRIVDEGGEGAAIEGEHVDEDDTKGEGAAWEGDHTPAMDSSPEDEEVDEEVCSAT